MKTPTRYQLVNEGFLEPAEKGEFVTYDDYKALATQRDLWQAREAEARRGIPACELCPHLGSGDPLVDSNTRQLIAALKNCAETLGRVMRAYGINNAEAQGAVQKAGSVLQKQRGSTHAKNS